MVIRFMKWMRNVQIRFVSMKRRTLTYSVQNTGRILCHYPESPIYIVVGFYHFTERPIGIQANTASYPNTTSFFFKYKPPHWLKEGVKLYSKSHEIE